MAKEVRSETMTLRLNPDEAAMRDTLAERHGITGSGVMRQALRRWARKEGLLPSQQSTGDPGPAPKGKRRGGE